MSIPKIIYVVSILLSLYSVWLAMFHTYKMEYGEVTDIRVRMPNIIYVLMFIVSFVPIGNILMLIIFVVASLIGRYVDRSFYVKSWLFDTMSEKEDKEER